MGEKQGVYAFCSIPESKPKKLGKVTLDHKERELYSIPFKDCSMVVAKAPLKIIKPNKENLLAHQKTVSRIMEDYAVIPMSFGNVFRNDEDIEHLLGVLYEEYQNLFPKLENKIEVGLKIIGRKEWMEALVNQNKRVSAMKEEVKGKSENASFYDKIELGEVAKDFFEEIQQNVKSEIYDPLSELAESSIENDVVGERMFMNAAFLIDRNMEDKFDKKVNDLYERFPDQYDFKYSGPWPPYNFVNIKLKVEKEQ